jgi:general L-amino acid transport system permease protein
MLFLNDARFRAVFYQFLAISLVLLAAWAMYATASANLAKQDIATGFDFLSRQAGIAISESSIAYGPTDTVARAILVGLINTIKVSFLAALFGTIIGVLVGIGRMSTNPLLSRLMLAYVELLRNVPLLLYLFLWYFLIILVFPPVRQAIQLFPGFFLSNSGLAMPALEWHSGFELVLSALILGIVAALVTRTISQRRRIATGKANAGFIVALVLLVLPVLAVWASGAGFAQLERARGRALPPHRRAADPPGVRGTAHWPDAQPFCQRRRDRACGHPGGQQGPVGSRPGARPAALAHAPPRRAAAGAQGHHPAFDQHLSHRFKNSSLAIAIGYPDLVMVSNTIMNQTGQAMETIAIFMGIYLGLSVAISLFMNWYNARVALKAR